MSRRPERKIPWYLLPEPKMDDTRDAEEHAVVAAALAALPGDHPARRAYAKGTNTIALTHLVSDRRDIVDALTEAYLAGNRRALGRSGPFRP